MPITGFNGLPQIDPAATNVLDNTPDVNMPDVSGGVAPGDDALTRFYLGLVSGLSPSIVSQEEIDQLDQIANDPNSSDEEKTAAKSQKDAAIVANSLSSPFIRLVILTYIVTIILMILKRIPGVSGVPSVSDIAKGLFGEGYEWTDDLEVDGFLLLDDSLFIAPSDKVQDTGSISNDYRQYRYIPSMEIKEATTGDAYQTYPLVSKVAEKHSGFSIPVFTTSIPVFPQTVVNSYSVYWNKFNFKLTASADYYFKFATPGSVLRLGDDEYVLDWDGYAPHSPTPLIVPESGSMTRATGRVLDMTVNVVVTRSEDKSSFTVSSNGFAENVPEEYSNPTPAYVRFYKNHKYIAADNRIELGDAIDVTNLKFEGGTVNYGYDINELNNDSWTSLCESNAVLGTQGGAADPYYCLEGNRFGPYIPSQDTEEYGASFVRNRKNGLVFSYSLNSDPNTRMMMPEEPDSNTWNQNLYIGKIMFKGIHRLDIKGREKKFPSNLVYDNEYEEFYADHVQIWGYRYYDPNSSSPTSPIKNVEVFFIDIDDSGSGEHGGMFYLKSNNEYYKSEAKVYSHFETALNKLVDALADLMHTPSQSYFEAAKDDVVDAYSESTKRFYSYTSGTSLTRLTTHFCDEMAGLHFYMTVGYVSEQAEYGWAYVFSRAYTLVSEIYDKYSQNLVESLKEENSDNTKSKTMLLTNGWYNVVSEKARQVKIYRPFYPQSQPHGVITLEAFGNMCRRYYVTNNNQVRSPDFHDGELHTEFAFSTEELDWSLIDLIAKFDDDSDYPLNGEETSGSDDHFGILGGYTYYDDVRRKLFYSNCPKKPFISFTKGRASTKNTIEFRSMVERPFAVQDVPVLEYEVLDPCTIPQASIDRKLRMLVDNDADDFSVMAAFGCCYTPDLLDKFHELKKQKRHMVRW